MVRTRPAGWSDECLQHQHHQHTGQHQEVQTRTQPQVGQGDQGRYWRQILNLPASVFHYYGSDPFLIIKEVKHPEFSQQQILWRTFHANDPRLCFLYPDPVLDPAPASAPVLGTAEETPPLLSSTCVTSSSAQTPSLVWTGQQEEEQEEQHTAPTTITTTRYTTFRSCWRKRLVIFIKSYRKELLLNHMWIHPLLKIVPKKSCLRDVWWTSSCLKNLLYFTKNETKCLWGIYNVWNTLKRKPESFERRPAGKNSIYAGFSSRAQEHIVDKN